MPCKLLQFRITHFRAIQDSGWLSIRDLNGFIGANESGKTTLLLGLSKLNPSHNEPINPLQDFPRKDYTNYASQGKKRIFVQAIFALPPALTDMLTERTDFIQGLVRRVYVARRYNGNYVFELPEMSKREILAELFKFYQDITRGNYNKILLKGAGLTVKFLAETLDESYEEKSLGEIIEELTNRLDNYEAELGDEDHITKQVTPLRYAAHRALEFYEEDRQIQDEKVIQAIFNELPRFLYFSEEGNLDSEMYLPYLLNDLERSNLGQREKARLRTFRVLLKLIGLNPEELKGEISKEKRHEQQVLLKSASSTLTEKFRKWWRQGNYQLRFELDGDHLRIWVSDELRPEELELDARSRGLQWFFSFFLVYLAEHQSEAGRDVFLLDEAGQALHPLAQRDLLAFLQSLADKNQLIYTTHSPFLISPAVLSRIRLVYVDEEGHTCVTSEPDFSNLLMRRALHPMRTSIRLMAAETLLYGAQTVLVAEEHDQFYLQLMRMELMQHGMYGPEREIVFLPAGDAQGMAALCEILRRDGHEPVVLLPGDKKGRSIARSLKRMLNTPPPVRFLDDLLKQVTYSEDLLPKPLLAKEFSRLYQAQDGGDEFDETYNENGPLKEQMVAFALRHKIVLSRNWRSELARRMMRAFLRRKPEVSEKLRQKWERIFKALLGAALTHPEEKTLQEERRSDLQALQGKLHFIAEELEEELDAEAIQKPQRLLQKVQNALKKVEENPESLKQTSLPDRLERLQKQLPEWAKWLDEETLESTERLCEKLLA